MNIFTSQDIFLIEGINTPGCMSLIVRTIYLRERIFMVADTELIQLIPYLIQPPGSIPGVG